MYQPAADRYERMQYQRCGNSGIMLPRISLGLWHNFGSITPFEVQQSLLRTAFDHGIVHFDLANNYGPPYGEAERNFGLHMERDWKPYRDELFLSTKAGYDMWPGPYGNFGSKKYLMASIDQSLRRMHVDYVDVFYHHRPDPDTPLEETMDALCQIVRSGKALYVGISNYRHAEAEKAIALLKKMGTPCLLEQPNYSLLDRWIEQGLTDVLRREGVGCIVFAPLQNGLLTGKYLNGIPVDSRAARDPRYLTAERALHSQTDKISALQKLAQERGQRLQHLALQWVLRDDVVTSALIGASKPEQITDNLQALNAPHLTADELKRIDNILNGEKSEE